MKYIKLSNKQTNVCIKGLTELIIKNCNNVNDKEFKSLYPNLCKVYNDEIKIATTLIEGLKHKAQKQKKSP